MNVHFYECVLSIRESVVSVNRFKSINGVVRWLDDVDLSLCDVTIFSPKGHTIDPYDLLKIWRS